MKKKGFTKKTMSLAHNLGYLNGRLDLAIELEMSGEYKLEAGYEGFLIAVAEVYFEMEQCGLTVSLRKIN